MNSFYYLESVCCSVYSSNCCFLTCIQVSQEASQVIWYAHLFQNFPQLIVIHTVKDLAESVKQKEMFFWNSLAFSMIQQMLTIWSLVPLPFLKPAWTSGNSWFSKARGTRNQIANIRWINEGRGLMNWEGEEKHSQEEYPVQIMLIRLSKP